MCHQPRSLVLAKPKPAQEANQERGKESQEDSRGEERKQYREDPKGNPGSDDHHGQIGTKPFSLLYKPGKGQA